MKIRAFSFFVLSFCSFFAFADGSCRLVVDENGQYTIICEGDGVEISYIEEYRTNHVYIIENCEELKDALRSKVNNINSDLLISYGPLSNILFSANQIYYSTSSDSLGLYIRDQVSNIERDVESIRNNMSFVSVNLVGDTSTSLLSLVNSIECGSCTNSPSGSGGSCCSGVDLEPIVSRLNIGIIQRDVITNNISIIANFLSGILHQLTPDDSTLIQGVPYMMMDYYGGKFRSYNSTSWWTDPLYDSLANNVLMIGLTAADGWPSVNNYLYNIWHYQNSVLTNKITSIETNLYSFFTLFRDNVVGIPPSLTDWTPSDGAYYDYLTNFYLRVNSGHVLSSEMSRTNWFGRIESLLAALVFSDHEDGTNTVDRNYGSSDKQSLNELVSNLGGNMNGHIGNMTRGSDNVLSVVRRLSLGFSEASMPSSVVLVTIPDGDSQTRSSGSYGISFDSSEFSSLIEIFRCCTTLAWSFIGLLLFVKFSWWASRTSYSLIVFCWGVLSGIFGGKS